MAVSGPGTVVQSVGHGNLVAQAVDAYLTTGQLTEVYVKPKRHDIPQLFNLENYAEARRPMADGLLNVMVIVVPGVSVHGLVSEVIEELAMKFVGAALRHHRRQHRGRRGLGRD